MRLENLVARIVAGSSNELDRSMEDIKRSKLKNRPLRKSVVLAAAISALAGCGSGHSVTPTVYIASTGGLFGANLNSSASAQIALITENGAGWLYDNPAKLDFSLSLDVPHEVLLSDGTLVLSGTITEYDETSGAVIASGTLQANVLTHSSIVLTYTLGSAPSSSYTLTYLSSGFAGYAQPSSLATITGSYHPTPDSAAGASQITSIDIDATGKLGGSDSAGCVYAGAVALVDTNYNAYQLNNLTETCGAGAPIALTGQALVYAKTATASQQLVLSISNASQQSAVNISLLTN